MRRTKATTHRVRQALFTAKENSPSTRVLLRPLSLPSSPNSLDVLTNSQVREVAREDDDQENDEDQAKRRTEKGRAEVHAHQQSTHLFPLELNSHSLGWFMESTDN